MVLCGPYHPITLSNDAVRGPINPSNGAVLGPINLPPHRRCQARNEAYSRIDHDMSHVLVADLTTEIDHVREELTQTKIDLQRAAEYVKAQFT